MDWPIVSTVGTADDVETRSEKVLVAGVADDRERLPKVPEVMGKMTEDFASVFQSRAESSLLEKYWEPMSTQREDR